MIKVFLAGILLVSLPLSHCLAQSDGGYKKAYSGYLLARAGWNKMKLHQESQCSVEFHIPPEFTKGSSYVLPERLSYFIKFKNPGFEKFFIKVYTNDGQDYTIDPYAEGSQVNINDEHHIVDSYLIYLILGTSIGRLEIQSSAGEEGDRYILDKLVVGRND